MFLTFFKKLFEKLAGTRKSSQHFLDNYVFISPYDYREKSENYYRSLLKEDVKNRFYVSINKGILEILEKNGVNLLGEDWRRFFSVAWLEGAWDDGTFGLRFPLLEKFVANTGAKESELSYKWKTDIDTSLWHVPKSCIEPIENMEDANILLTL